MPDKNTPATILAGRIADVIDGEFVHYTNVDVHGWRITLSSSDHAHHFAIVVAETTTAGAPEQSNSPAAAAIRQRLAYLEDNLYRWRRMGGAFHQQDREIAEYEQAIAELKADAQRLGIKL